VLIILFLAIIFPVLPIKIVDSYLLNEDFILLTTYFWPLLILIMIGCIIIYIIYRKKDLEIIQPFNKINFAIIFSAILIFLALPYFTNAQKIIKNSPNGSVVSNRSVEYASDFALIGGQATIDFLKTTPKMIYLMDNVSMAQNFLLYGDIFLFEYPYGVTDLNSSNKFYDTSKSDEERLALIKKWGVNYVVVRHQEEAAWLDKYPDLFRQVYKVHYTFTKPRDLFIYQFAHK